MFRSGIRPLAAALAVACCAAAAQADVKIKSRNNFGGQTSESTVYIKGKRQRTEGQGGITSIMQCDLRRSLQLSPQTKTYTVSQWGEVDASDAAGQAVKAGGPAEPSRKGGVVTSTITTTDTGERKQMFGYTARRIKTSMVTESSPDACQQTKSRVETDGWYIDLAVEFDCYDHAGGGYTPAGAVGGCRDVYRTRQVGKGRTGYPVLLTTTLFDEAGNPTYTMTQEVLEVSKASLDAALFEAPPDYREVKDASELYAAALASARQEAGGEDSGAAPGAVVSGGTQANAQGTQDAPAVGPKKPGVVRLGVAVPRATAAEGLDSNVLAEAVRNTLINHLRGSSLEVVTLDARLPAQAEGEARQKECDYVVHTTAVHKKGGGGGGGFGGFLKKASPVVSHVPLGGVPGDTGAAVTANVAATAVYNAAAFSGSVKARDELSLDYTLQREGAAVLSNKLSAKAKSDGEDLISRLAEQAAAAVVKAASQK